jgi:hypothetical protein
MSYDVFIPDAATIQAERIDLTTDELLASKGFDPTNAQPIDSPKIVDEESDDGAIYDVNRHTWEPQTHVAAPDDDSEPGDDIDGMRDALAFTVASIEAHPVDGDDSDNVSLMSKHREAAELHALMKRNAAREALKVRDLSSDRAFRAAVLKGDTRTAQRLMQEVIQDTKAPYALRVACVTATIELVPDDCNCNGEWLHGITGLPLRTCQDLISSSRSLIAGLASELVGTKDETWKGVRAIGEMSPKVQSRVIEAVRKFRTSRLLELACKREKARRVRGISLSELRMLAPIGLCNEEGWTTMTELSAKDSTSWLSEAFDKSTATTERKGDVASIEDTSTAQNGRARSPAREYVYGL